LKPGSEEPVVLSLLSPPTRGRGLKLAKGPQCRLVRGVAPHAGAWIETTRGVQLGAELNGRPPRGGVD